MIKKYLADRQLDLAPGARPSVLEAYAGKSIYTNHGQRVVNSCRLMQPAMISGYLSRNSDTFDVTIANFANAYADQNERDHAVFKKPVREGKVEAIIEGE